MNFNFIKTFSKVNSNWWSLFLWSPLVKMTCPPTSNTVVIVPSVWPNILSRKGRGKMEHEVKITLLKQWPIVSEVSEVCSFGITTNFNRLPDELLQRNNNTLECLGSPDDVAVGVDLHIEQKSLVFTVHKKPENIRKIVPSCWIDFWWKVRVICG